MYTNVYTWASNQMMMIKSNGGSGTLSNVVFENFIGKNPPLHDSRRDWSVTREGR